MVRDAKTNKRYYYILEVYSQKTMEKLLSQPNLVKFQSGYLLPDVPMNHRIIGDLSQMDETQKYEDKKIKVEQEYQALLEKKTPDYALVNEVLGKISRREEIAYTPGSCSQLMNHQRGGTLIAERFDKFAFFYDTGTGKTLMALDIIRRKAETKEAHFLILCPKTVIATAWMDDCSQFYPKLRILPMSNNYTSAEQLRKLSWQWRKSDMDFQYAPCFFLKNKRQRDQESRKYMLTQAEHLIVNFELFNRTPEKYLKIGEGDQEKNIDGIIVDESSVLKSGSNVLLCNLWKCLCTEDIKYIYLLSGKPAPNKIQEYYPQIELVAPYLRLPSVRRIQQEDSNAKDELLKAIQKASITVSKKDCFDLPDTINITRKVELDSQLRKQYSSLAYQFVTELKDIEKENPKTSFIYKHHVFTSILKLRQFTGGFVLNDGEPIHVHNKKLEELERIIEELGGEQAIIWCQFRHEIKEIEKRLTALGYCVVTAYGETLDKDASIRTFKSGKATFLIAHPKTLQFGVTLTNCCYAIYYAMSYSFEEYYQSHDRIYRKGQALPCTYIFIQAENTIDEVVHRVVIEKKNETERIELFLKHMENDMKGAE